MRFILYIGNYFSGGQDRCFELPSDFLAATVRVYTNLINNEINIFLIFFLISIDLFGTGQIPDFLIYKGDTLSLYSNPLESYFNFWHKRPTKLFDEIGCNTTATWRGYIGYWELRNDSLFLKRLEGDTCDIDLSLIFKKKVKNGEVFADWLNLEIKKMKIRTH